MGSEKKFYIGAYVVIEPLPFSAKALFIRCSEHGSMDKGDYCSICGAKLERWLEPVDATPHLFDLLDYADERLAEIIIKSGSKKIYAVGNMNIARNLEVKISISDYYANEYDLTGFSPTTLIENFKIGYADVLADLTSKVAKLEIKFGVLTYTW